eukprot:COSAG02_NODE_55588_length_289_cov_1.447368_1_plen_51_part_10
MQYYSTVVWVNFAIIVRVLARIPAVVSGFRSVPTAPVRWGFYRGFGSKGTS